MIMTRFSKSILLMGCAVLALGACSSTKGPGKLGTKNDIVVRNNGMPGAQQAAGADFSSTVEQAAAVPAPDVAVAEPLPDNSPAMKEAVAEHESARAPLPSTPQQTASETTAPPSEIRPLDQMAPTEPVAATNSATPPAPEATDPAYTPPATTMAAVPATPESAPVATPEPPASVYPARDYVAAAAPAPQPPVAAPTTPAKYPLDPNAPYSPKAVAAAGIAPAATTMVPASAAPAPIAGVPSMTDPATVKSAQAALKAKGGFTGPETGTVDADFLNALTIYQGQNGLPQGGLNESTLRALGVIQ